MAAVPGPGVGDDLLQAPLRLPAQHLLGLLVRGNEDGGITGPAGRPALQKAGVYYGLILAFVSGAVISGLVTPLAGRWTVLCACPALLGAFFLMLRPGRA